MHLQLCGVGHSGLSYPHRASIRGQIPVVWTWKPDSQAGAGSGHLPTKPKERPKASPGVGPSCVRGEAADQVDPTLASHF